MLPAQRCAVVAAAPPAVPLQRRFSPRSARAVRLCGTGQRTAATARCRSIAASLCACSASPAGARRCASPACASAIQRCAQPLRSHRPQHEHSCSRLRRCAALPQQNPQRCIALHCTGRGACGSASLRPIARAHYGCLHRPCSLQGILDNGCDSAACGRTGDARAHPRCACAPSRAHIPAFTASPTQTAGAPAAPQPPLTVEAVNDTGAPLYTTGVSTHRTLGKYHREYSDALGCARIAALRRRARSSAVRCRLGRARPFRSAH